MFSKFSFKDLNILGKPDSKMMLASQAKKTDFLKTTFEDFFLDKNYICMIYEPTICFFLQKIRINNFSG